MRKVSAHLIFARIHDNELGKFHYVARRFFIVKGDGSVQTLVRYGHDLSLAFRYESMQNLIEDMKSILKESGFYSKDIIIDDTVYHGIICTEIDYETVISSPTLFPKSAE